MGLYKRDYLCYLHISSTKMRDQEGKIKNQYISWPPEKTKTLLRLLVDGVNQNWTDASGKFNKLTVEQRILPELNKICGSKKTFSQYKNKTKILKKKHKGFVDLLRFSSGFGWDKDTKKFTTPNEVWNEYLQGHKKDTYLRDDTFEDFEDLEKVYGQNIAKGNNTVGTYKKTLTMKLRCFEVKWL
ncbi:unnamed protein product [Brassica oleracea]